jgi:hypothetical protein
MYAETPLFILTFNTPDYVRLHFDWLQRGRTHAGIIVSDQLPIGETIHGSTAPHVAAAQPLEPSDRRRNEE